MDMHFRGLFLLGTNLPIEANCLGYCDDYFSKTAYQFPGTFRDRKTVEHSNS